MSFGPPACVVGFTNRRDSIFPTFAENPCDATQVFGARQ